MKKVLILALMAVMASAGMVANTSVSYGNVDATATVAGISATASTKVTSLRQDVGYEWSNIRAVGYAQLDNYKDELIATTESDAVSYGVEVDYIHAINDRFGFFVGGLVGKGTKDLGSEGDIVGIGSISFTDVAVRSGVNYTMGSWLLETGFENKVRNYNDESYGGYTIELEEKIQTLFISAGYKF